MLFLYERLAVLDPGTIRPNRSMVSLYSPVRSFFNKMQASFPPKTELLYFIGNDTKSYESRLSSL